MTLEEVHDVSELVSLQIDDANPTERLRSNGMRRPTKRGLYGAARRLGCAALADRFGLGADQLGDNVQALSQYHLPSDDLVPPLEAASDFVATLEEGEASVELRTAEGALAGAREILAQT
eukprot:1218186-Prymnesium_polylepis.1